MAKQTVKVTSNIMDLPIVLTSINEKAVRQSVARSIRRTTQGVRKKTFEEIRDQAMLDTKMLSARKLKERQYITDGVNAKSTAPIDQMFGVVNMADKRPSMIFFFAQRTPFGHNQRTGATQYFVKAKVMGRTVGLGRAFIAYPDSKRAVVLARTGRARLPVKKLFGPSIAYMMQATGSITRIQTEALARFEREMNTNLTYFISKI